MEGLRREESRLDEAAGGSPLQSQLLLQHAASVGALGSLELPLLSCLCIQLKWSFLLDPHLCHVCGGLILGAVSPAEACMLMPWA